MDLRIYAEGDFWLLERNNAPEQTEHLGGPESPEKLAGRHERYLKLDPAGSAMYVVLAQGEPAGLIGFWEKEWQGEEVFETGWGILPEMQGRGLATAAALAVAEKARALGTRRYLHAYPKADHPASNAICRKAGFGFVATVDFEYPIGNPIRCNDWRLDLRA